MSVLIKGMEMPKNCKECRFCFYDRKYEPMCLLLNGKRGKSDCPLVEIPPHGRLIDADALMENEENISFKDEWHMTVTEAFVSVKNIAHAPTILESTMGQVNSEKAINEAEGGET